MAQLTLTFSIGGDLSDQANGFGDAGLAVEVPGFSAVAKCYGLLKEIERFATQLSVYPMPPVAITLDLAESDIDARPEGNNGYIRVTARIVDGPQRADLSLLADYASIERFASGLRAIAAGTANEATLLTAD